MLKISWNSDQQLRCQTCCKLYKRAEAIQFLAQQLIVELQQAWSGSQHLRSISANDGDDDGDEDDDGDDENEGVTGNDSDCEEIKDNTGNDAPHRKADGPESATISCPHPACKDNPPYSQKNNLQRHYTNHVECDEIYEFCGHRSTQVRNYVTHYDKCRAQNGNDSSGDKRKTAAMKKRILCRKAATELDEMSKAREDKLNSKDHGESDTTAPSAKRRRTAGDALATDSTTTIPPNLPFDLTRNTASTTEPTSCSFDEFPQSNGHNNYFPITNSELLTPMMTNDELVGQFGEQFPRATVFSSRTMDWNQPYFTKPQYRSDTSGQSTLIYSQSMANPFAEVVAADVDGVEQSSISKNNTELMALYGSALAVGLDNNGPI